MGDKFVEIAGQYVRADAITRVAAPKSVPGAPGLEQAYIHLSDGSSAALNEDDYRRVMQLISPKAEPAKKEKVSK